MVNGGHPDAAFIDPLAVLPGDAVILPDQPFGGDPAQADDDLRLHQSHLVAQVTDAGILLCFQGIPVPGRSALDDVGNIAVMPPGQIDDPQHIVQQLSCRPHKGLPLQVLLLTGALPHEHHIRPGITLAEDHIVPPFAQTTFGASLAGFL